MTQYLSLYDTSLNKKIKSSIERYYGLTDVAIYNKSPNNPTSSDIPDKDGVVWVNYSTGELFVYNASSHVWIGSQGTNVSVSTVSVFDIFGDNSALALYRFEGNAYDDGGTHNGTWYGTEQYSSGKFGQAAYFNNKSSYIRCNKFYSSTPSFFSISLWANCFDSSSSSLFLGDADSSFANYCWFFEVYPTYIRYDAYPSSGGAITYNYSFIMNFWYHLCLVKNGTTVSFYINGQNVGNYTSTESNGYGYYFYMGQRGSIGSSNYGNVYYKLDQVRIFNRSLTASEVSALYNES